MGTTSQMYQKLPYTSITFGSLLSIHFHKKKKYECTYEDESIVRNPQEALKQEVGNYRLKAILPKKNIPHCSL